MEFIIPVSFMASSKGSYAKFGGGRWGLNLLGNLCISRNTAYIASDTNEKCKTGHVLEGYTFPSKVDKCLLGVE